MSNSILPPNATLFEKSVEATAIDATKLRVPLRDLWSPDNCPIEVIAWLGWALSVDDWDSEWSEPQKRSAVRNSIQVHRQKGTVGAVKRAISVLGYEVEIDEKTGQVYTFNVRLKALPEQSPSTTEMDEAERLALGAKNVRSHLSNVGVLLEGDAAVKISSAQVSGEKTIIWPETVDMVEEDPAALFLAAEQSFESITIAPFFDSQFESTLNHAVAAVASYTITINADAA